jgi:hypothetical protein
MDITEVQRTERQEARLSRIMEDRLTYIERLFTKDNLPLNDSWFSSILNLTINPPIVEGLRYVYIYTDCDRKLAKKYKVGDTRINPYRRMYSQDTTSNSDPLEMIAYFHSPWSRDREVHKFLPQDSRIRPNREWFILNNPIEDVRMAILLSDYQRMSYINRQHCLIEINRVMNEITILFTP